jgi:AraC family transcriptional regulator
MGTETGAIQDVLAKRFRIERPPTVVTRPVSSAPIVFSRLRSSHAIPGRSMSVPLEEAFAFQVPLSMPFFSGLWVAGKRLPQPAVAPGDAFLFDLSTNPTVGLTNPFDSLRLYIPRTTLDELAYDRGLRRVGGLRARTFGGRDMVLYGLAQALVAAMERSDGGIALFADYVGLAFHNHIIHAYGGVSTIETSPQGGLARWQLRRVYEFIDSNLAGNPSLSQLANECRLSARYFARAFKRSVGMPPHQWLMRRRIDRAKELLLKTGLDLADIAMACGFVDQSYFTRVFSRYEGLGPGKWRREQRA